MQVTNCGPWHMPLVIRHRAQSQRELCHLPWTVLLLAGCPGIPLLGANLARAQAPLALRQGPCDALLLMSCNCLLQRLSCCCRPLILQKPCCCWAADTATFTLLLLQLLQYGGLLRRSWLFLLCLQLCCDNGSEALCLMDSIVDVSKCDLWTSPYML